MDSASERKRPIITFQTIMYGLLVAAFVYALYRYRGQLLDIFDVLQQGIWYLVLASMIVLALSVYNQAMLYVSIYSLLDIPSHRHEMLPLYLIRRFVTVAAPSGGFSGWVPFLQFARRRDLAVGAVFVANLIYTILWYSTFGVFLLIGLLYLFFLHDLQWFEISAAIVMLVTDLVMIVLFALAWTAPHYLERVLMQIGRRVEVVAGRIRRKAPVGERQLTTFATDLTRAMESMRRAGTRHLAAPVLHAFLNEALNILTFYVIALAFDMPASFGVMVAAYSVSILFFVVSPTPGGLGFVEGTLIVVLTTLGVPPEKATVVTLAYRGISFWLPFVLGFTALRWFNRHPDVGRAVDAEA
ncbi:MAG: flippase-like domain-containing protein [Anaerolineae bacterium]|nr:flippase-like domain-containing protein [Anaerolineae bacterium]